MGLGRGQPSETNSDIEKGNILNSNELFKIFARERRSSEKLLTHKCCLRKPNWLTKTLGTSF